jgi:ribosome-associated protein
VQNAALDKKAEDLISLDIRARTILTDHFVIATGRSNIQTRAIADGISEALRNAGYAAIRTEGYNEGTWILLDLGPVIVHIFTPEQRAFYNLERLWGASAAEQEAKLQAS